MVQARDGEEPWRQKEGRSQEAFVWEQVVTTSPSSSEKWV